MRSSHSSASRLISVTHPSWGGGAVAYQVSCRRGAERTGGLPTKTAVAEAHPALAIGAAVRDGGLHRQRVEELVREKHAAELRRHLAGADLHRHVAPFRKGLGHFAASGAQLHHGEIRRLAHGAPQLAHARRHQNSKDRLDLFRREEIARAAERVMRPAVIAALRVIERYFHEAAEGDRPLARNLRREQFTGRSHVPGGVLGAPWSRLCGVRTNISTR